jgi:curved DNA-binding protein CbpA
MQSKENMEDYYQILGVSHDSSLAAIKAAYKHKAFLLHPDRNTAPDATAAFQRLGNAWDTLRDEKSRQDYDKKFKIENQHRQPQNPKPKPKPSPWSRFNPFRAARNRPRHDTYEEESFGWPKPAPAPAGPTMPLETDGDIIQAQIALQAMQSEYRTKVLSLSFIVESMHLPCRTYKSYRDVLEAAEIDPAMIQRRQEIACLEEAIRKRFAERYAEVYVGGVHK